MEKNRSETSNNPILLQKISWMQAPAAISIDNSDIHLWRCLFDNAAVESTDYQKLLSAHELQRAARFVNGHDRERFIFFHGALRTILSAYTHIQPHLLQFCRNSYGKPYILSPEEPSKLQFSLTHSKDIALIAVTWDRPIGVDVEYIRPIEDGREIVRNYFSLAERSVLLPLEGEAFNVGFFLCWTQKESFIKATGFGLSRSLDQFTVPIFRADAEVSCVESEAWRFETFTAHAGYIGAFAVGSSSRTEDYFNLS